MTWLKSSGAALAPLMGIGVPSGDALSQASAASATGSIVGTVRFAEDPPPPLRVASAGTLRRRGHGSPGGWEPTCSSRSPTSSWRAWFSSCCTGGPASP